jgi:hypothetical protein
MPSPIEDAPPGMWPEPEGAAADAANDRRVAFEHQAPETSPKPGRVQRWVGRGLVLAVILGLLWWWTSGDDGALWSCSTNPAYGSTEEWCHLKPVTLHYVGLDYQNAGQGMRTPWSASRRGVRRSSTPPVIWASCRSARPPRRNGR